MRLGRQFAVAVLTGDYAAAGQLLTPAARKRLGRAGLDRLLPSGWDATVRHYGGRKQAAAMYRKHLTVNAQPGGEAADSALFTHAAPDVPPNSVRGMATVYPFDRESDVDPMCYLFFVGKAATCGSSTPSRTDRVTASPRSSRRSTSPRPRSSSAR